jgi:hypothetical protein
LGRGGNKQAERSGGKEYRYKFVAIENGGILSTSSGISVLDSRAVLIVHPAAVLDRNSVLDTTARIGLSFL